MKDARGCAGALAIHTPDWPDPGKGEMGTGAGERHPGPRILAEGYSVFTESQIHERARGDGMGVASVRRTRSNGRAECCAGGGSRGEGVV